jgi:hypothetical protein
MNNENYNSNDFALPEVGQTINLTHKEFHQDRRIFAKYHSAEIGEAVIISANLIGEDRVIHPKQKLKSDRVSTILRTISQAESESLLKDCLLAQTKSNLKLNELASVSW